MGVEKLTYDDIKPWREM